MDKVKVWVKENPEKAVVGIVILLVVLFVLA